jgi:F-type H+-transporting ATPase subunit gamma
LGVVITSNRGLCGSFHSQLEKKIRQVTDNPASLLAYPLDAATAAERRAAGEIDFEWIVVGRKGEKMIRRLNQPILASFNKLNENVDTGELNVVFKVIREAFDAGKFQKVVIFYTQYINSMHQVPVVGQLLPIAQEEIQRLTDQWAEYMPNFAQSDTNKVNYLIEPNREALIDVIFQLLLKSLLYYYVLESKASVESARMLAMKNATDAAMEMRGLLTLAYNQLRQSKITNEIAEISAGRAALA